MGDPHYFEKWIKNGSIEGIMDLYVEESSGMGQGSSKSLSDGKSRYFI